jgi:hypothetical protein
VWGLGFGWRFGVWESGLKEWGVEEVKSEGGEGRLPELVAPVVLALGVVIHCAAAVSKWEGLAAHEV